MYLRLFSILFIALLRFPMGASAQMIHDHSDSGNKLMAHAQAAAANQLPVSVNGMNTPQLIPDDLAWRHFILSVSEHSVASSDDQQRRTSRLRLTGLSASDQNSLISALAGVREQLDAIDLTRASTAATNTTALAQLLAQQTSILNSARIAIRGAVSAAGMTVLNNFVNNTVKRGIIIYASN
ncbi:MAG TPA: hypothetical protein VGL82_19350 [Bryobacteraceae bacterium]|jgi:hypothetical protein